MYNLSQINGRSCLPFCVTAGGTVLFFFPEIRYTEKEERNKNFVPRVWAFVRKAALPAPPERHGIT